MAWLESAGTNLPPLLYNSLLALLIAGLTVGLAWGIRPAILFLLRRMRPAWSKVAATLVQALVLFGGMVLIVVVGGGNALLIVAAVGGAFWAGITLGGETLLADRLAAIRIRMRKRYQVGDEVTVGKHHRGIVTQISGAATCLDTSEHATVVVRNSQVLRNPILVHRKDDAPTTAAAVPLPAEQNRGEGEQSGGRELIGPTVQRADTDAHPTALVLYDGADVLPARLPDASQPDISQPDAEIDPTSTAPTVQPVASPAQQPAAWSGTIRSSVAVPLTKRPVLGKRTTRDLR